MPTMAQDVAWGEKHEEEALDELLLLMLAGEGEPRGEVFHERRRRIRLGLELGPEGASVQAPLRRDDEGTALRLVGPRGVCAAATSQALERRP